MSNRRHIVTAKEAESLAKFIVGLPLPFTVSWTEGGKRSLDQNSLVHKWFGEIAQQAGDRTAIEVKGHCNVTWGVPIMLRDPGWAWVWNATGARLNYEQQCRLLTSENIEIEGKKGRKILHVTSAMTTKELSEYMDAMSAHYRAEGFRLTDPEILKYGDGND